MSARRYPDKPLRDLLRHPPQLRATSDQVEALAGYLQQVCGVQPGDRVLLYMQNSPQFMLAYYAILRANAVVVPVNPMNLTEELRHYVEDSGASHHRHGARLDAAGPAADRSRACATCVVATYCDYLTVPTDLPVPDFVAAPREQVRRCEGVAPWTAMLARRAPSRRHHGRADDLCVMPYTSGTTGQPEGLHAHAPQRDVQRAGRRACGSGAAGAAWRCRCCRCST